MKQQKQLIRKNLLAKRKLLPAGYVESTSYIVCERVFQGIDWSGVKSVCTYQPAPQSGEIDTTPLLTMLANLPNPPKVTEIEPHAKATTPSGLFDVILVPVVGFDDQNYRLGQGGGWYDRFLHNQKQALTIGLAHSGAKTSFPHEPHDIPLDYIFTDNHSLS